MVIVTNILRATSKRIPLIKFRKGGAVMSASDEFLSSTGSTNKGATENAGVSQKSTQIKSKSTVSARGAPVIEDWQLPERYRRKPLDPEEMDYINRGGPA